MQSLTQQDRSEEQATVKIYCLGLVNGEISALTPSATGFYVTISERRFLVTNRHVVTGRHPHSNEVMPPGVPQQLVVEEIDNQASYRLDLYDGDSPQWFECSHKTTFEGQPSWIDVAVMNVSPGLSSVSMGANEEITLGPIEQVCVVGYPYIRSRPIWKTCHVAETVQPGPDYFLINGRTTKGMSGSPVYRPLFSWQTKFLAGAFAGVYSGRYADSTKLNELDIGIVWKPRIIREIVMGITGT